MNTIDAKGLQKAFLAGAKGLDAKKEWINEFLMEILVPI